MFFGSFSDRVQSGNFDRHLKNFDFFKKTKVRGNTGGTIIVVVREGKLKNFPKSYPPWTVLFLYMGKFQFIDFDASFKC